MSEFGGEGESTEKHCAYAGCSCLMQEEESYCSDECERAQGDGECDCGHLACRAAADQNFLEEGKRI